MAANPDSISHILMTTNTSAIAAVLMSTAASWILLGKPDLGMTINGCLAGLVAVTAGCAYVSVTSALIIGAIAGVAVVLAVMMFDRIKIDDPVGATAVHLFCGVLGTLMVGLFAESRFNGGADGLFFGGGWNLLGVQALGVVSVGGFVFVGAIIVWLLIKMTMGVRVSLKEEIEGLDIGEHGNQAYPEFVIHRPSYIAESRFTHITPVKDFVEAEKEVKI
jgi:Amt family ammonium transporter